MTAAGLNSWSATHCAACGAFLAGGYYTLLGSDDRFCETCFATRPRCDSCGAPLAPHHWKLHDERLHCSRCHNNAIYDMTFAHQLYDETIAGVASYPGLTLNVGVEFRIIDAPTLQNLRRGSEQFPAHLPEQQIRTLGLYQRKGPLRVIYLLYGLPRLIFRTTLAHEYAHAWQGENCPLLTNMTLIEGFAEWVAFYHLLWLGATRAARRMIETPHPYREALEHMFELEQRLGKSGVIEYMKRAVE
jgi:hypothetical protein